MLHRRIQVRLLGLLVTAALGAAMTIGNITTVNDIPICAISCLLEEIPSSSCPSIAVDKDCICRNSALRTVVYSCIKDKCTVRENFAAINITATACGVRPASTQAVSIEFYAVTTTVAIVFITARMAIKIAGISRWGWDDTTIVIAFTIHMATSLTGVLWGMTGSEIWALSPMQINKFFIISFVFGIRYFTNMSLIKASVLFGLLRIFPSKNFRRVLWGTQIFNLCFTLALLSAWVGQCQPVSFYWLGWDGEHKGSCVDKNALVLAHAVIHLSLDAWILVLPINQVAVLQLKRRKKIGAMLMFGVGFFLTVVSVLRLNALLKGLKSTSITTQGFWVAIWSNIENSVGIMVACMPAMRSLFTQLIIPKLRETMASRLHSTAPSTVPIKAGTYSVNSQRLHNFSEHSRGRSLAMAPNLSDIQLIRESEDERQRDVELGEMGDLGLRVTAESGQK